METNIFKPMVIGWSSQLTWTDDELKQAAQLLSAVSKANGGEIAPDVELDSETSNAFALQQVEGALARRVAPYAKELRATFVAPKFAKPLNDQIDPVLPELVPHEWNDLININTDDVDSLCKLPGVGRDLAISIIDYRQKVGSYSTIDQLIGVYGMGEENFAALKDQVFCGFAGQIGSLNTGIYAFMHLCKNQHFKTMWK